MRKHLFPAGVYAVRQSPVLLNNLKAVLEGLYLTFFSPDGFSILPPYPVAQDQLFDQACNTAGRQPGGGVTYGGDHDVQHDAAEQSGLRRYGTGRQQPGGYDTDQDLPRIGQKKNIEKYVVGSQRPFLQFLTLIVTFNRFSNQPPISGRRRGFNCNHQGRIRAFI